MIDHHAEEAELYPELFPLIRKTRLMVVCSINGVWVFARSAEGADDAIEIRELWEDPVLASPDFLLVPDREKTLRSALVLDADWNQVFRWDFDGYFGQDADPFANRRLPGLDMEGWERADSDASVVDIQRAVDHLTGKTMDRAALVTLSADLSSMGGALNPQKRGLKFEAWLERLLVAHGCMVERGKHIEGEQVDLFVHRPFRALVECRWQSDAVGVPAVSLLGSKLKRERPAVVIGIYVSMSGFTATAYEEATRLAAERVVLLFDRNDVNRALGGQDHLADLVEQRIDAVVRRY